MVGRYRSFAPDETALQFDSDCGFFGKRVKMRQHFKFGGFMRSVLSMILVAVCLTACGAKNPADPSPQPPKQQQPAPTPQPVLAPEPSAASGSQDNQPAFQKQKLSCWEI